MLSDEEKKAINDLNFIIVTDVYDNEVSIDKTKIINEYNESVGIALNLIEKQSKEIEELKNGQIDFWISDKEIEERIRNKFVSKDKIKAKIEEIDEVLKGQLIEKIRVYFEAQKEVLQSLLEKE